MTMSRRKVSSTMVQPTSVRSLLSAESQPVRVRHSGVSREEARPPSSLMRRGSCMSLKNASVSRSVTAWPGKLGLDPRWRGGPSNSEDDTSLSLKDRPELAALHCVVRLDSAGMGTGRAGPAGAMTAAGPAEGVRVATCQHAKGLDFVRVSAGVMFSGPARKLCQASRAPGQWEISSLRTMTSPCLAATCRAVTPMLGETDVTECQWLTSEMSDKTIAVISGIPDCTAEHRRSLPPWSRKHVKDPTREAASAISMSVCFQPNVAATAAILAQSCMFGGHPLGLYRTQARSCGTRQK
mmetsp:Transcript_34479/g.97692  ORF Transcript_34479/g.97692 Transcript_34479/m.97692 type:complete len:296 (+) Transcript_34479:1132-2019(+)